MNEAPSQQTGLGDTFGSQQSPQTNPFTADLKGEFNSNFGTNTNAVSQIFKEGGFVSQSRAKYLAIGGVVIVLAAVLFFVLTNEESSDTESTASDSETSEVADEPSEESSTESDSKEKAETPAAAETKPAMAAAPAAPALAPAAPAPMATATGFGSGKITLAEPAEGSSLMYDESQGPAQFSWTGGGGSIVFSRHKSMQPVEMRVRVNGNSYAFHHPWPGTWYWRVENRSGKTDVRTFTVGAPQRRNISVSQPTSGGSVAGTGGTVSWQGDSRVASYRVEFSTGAWANPQHRFASSGNSVQLQGVAPGQYQMRIGAFSEVAGRWEYTTPVNVTVQ